MSLLLGAEDPVAGCITLLVHCELDSSPYFSSQTCSLSRAGYYNSVVTGLYKKPAMHFLSGEQEEDGMGMRLESKEGPQNGLYSQHFLPVSDPPGNRTRSCRTSKAIQKAKGFR